MKSGSFKTIEFIFILFELGVDLYKFIPIVGDIEATNATNKTPKTHTL